MRLIRALITRTGGTKLPAGGNSSPIGGIEAGLAQVCPREDCGCRGWEWLFAAERSDEAGCSGRRACADDWERVAPGRPMRAWLIGRGRAQAKSTEALGQLSGSKAGLWEGRAAVLKQRGETPGNCNVMRDGVVCRKMGGQDAEQVVGADPWSCPRAAGYAHGPKARRRGHRRAPGRVLAGRRRKRRRGRQRRPPHPGAECASRARRGVRKKAGISGSPCSPPSPWWTLWAAPSSSYHV